MLIADDLWRWEIRMAISGQAVTFDCSNAEQLAGFWGGVLERPVDSDASEEFASIGSAGGAMSLMFVRVPEGKRVKNRVHLDLFTDDLEGEVKRIKQLGADVLATITEGGRWTTMTDPQGNEFDVVAAD
jgi:predicted enzyme related to lactoylglutathione lyase